MNILENIEPKNVFKYFEEICEIPHGSSDTSKISEYCVEFARNHNLRYIKDSLNNIIIFKDGTKDYENSDTIIIQGHLDMVCEKEKDCNIDFKNDGLELQVLDGVISAKGTTLGGDDGIAVAFALAILDSNDISHPPLEVVFTVDEEIGMLGAADIDCSPLKGKIMLNLDSEDEGYLLVSCAGGIMATCHLPVKTEEKYGKKISICVSGLLGGHSGVEIDKGRANANEILGRVLYGLKSVAEYRIVSVNGGLKDNAIPREATAEVIIIDEKYDDEILWDYEKQLNEILKEEYKNTDKDICVSIKCEKSAKYMTMCYTDTNNIITALFTLPGGIQKMSSNIENLVQTSLNLGILKTFDKEVQMSFAVRSSVKSEKQELMDKLQCLMENLNGYVTSNGDYPPWEYRKESKLRKLMIDIYREQTGKDVVVQALHAGVECGLFAGKIEELDCVSFGPDIKDIHTTAESMPIDSVKRTWDYVVEILKRLK